MAKGIIHKADSRGHADHGWLKSHHSFSFANYYDPQRMHFGVLRVLNDDDIAGGMGFGTHPHANMEIITIPLEGDLQHKDSMGNGTIIKNGDVQVMSAGTGIQHSEFNANEDKAVKLLQIWVIPNKQNVTPRYQQITLNPADRHNQLQQILSPNPDDAGVWIHQNAWFYLSKSDQGKTTEYTLKSEKNGIYLFVLNGEISIADQTLSSRDAIGIWEIDTTSITAESDAEFLLMEVPMAV
ncbi:MAG: pirin family protein [Bacteroidetes bacterium]|nr:pirin family protein [Bacteroidota bacterium]